MKGILTKMKNYFSKEYDAQRCDSDICIFLKRKYDEIDSIFEKRFEKQFMEEKTEELKKLINEVQACIYKKNWNNKNQYISKMISLVLGNAYLRLAQCQNEILKKPEENYERAFNYLGDNIDYLNPDEVDLLLLLNKGKYYRNTAQVGKKSDYEKALSIFNDIITSVENVNISDEKKLHLILDAKINIGRVSRYSYEFKKAQKIFLSLIKALETYMDINIRTQLYNCENLKLLLDSESFDKDVEAYVRSVKKEEVSTYIIGEYLLQSLIHIGIIYRKTKKYEEAIKIFELIRCIDENGEGNIDAQNNLGVCYRKLGYLEGRLTAKGKEYYKKAEKIFEELKNKGNRFAIINSYKCRLIHDENSCKEIIKELEEDNKDKLSNSVNLQLLLGKFYMKIKDYKTAEKYFKDIYEKKRYISRGSIGFKAYYNLAQCKICMGEYHQARNILSVIEDMLKKNHDYIDIMTEIDYAWCLMQEENYERAKSIYEKLLKKSKEEFDKKQLLMINNNLADCHIHLGEWDSAKNYIENVLDIEPDNCTATYFLGVNLLNDSITNKSSSFEEAYEVFDKLIGKRVEGISIISGWLISAILLYRNKRDNELKKSIIKRIQYSSDKISMKCYCYISDFILQLLQEDGEFNSNYNDVYRDFCRITLIEYGENRAFQILKDSMEFHYFESTDRAFILAHIVQMYKYILNIKNAQRVTLKKCRLPYHYTKLDTLNSLLIQKDNKKPRLRLWNTIYMNDAYEGKIFDELLNYVKVSDNNLPNDSRYQIDSNVYITSFSTEENSFQMWSIYGDNEKGVAIKFDNDFFDIGDEHRDLIMDSKGDEYALYAVKYLDMNDDILDKEEELIENLREINNHIDLIKEKLNELQLAQKSNKNIHFENANTKVNTFIADRINEIRFLFKTKSYEYEKELRLIRCSHNPKIDNENFDIPRLYIDVNRSIKDIDIKIGSKLELQQIKNLYVWLKSTRKVKKIEESKMYP